MRRHGYRQEMDQTANDDTVSGRHASLRMDDTSFNFRIFHNALFRGHLPR